MFPVSVIDRSKDITGFSMFKIFVLRPGSYFNFTFGQHSYLSQYHAPHQLFYYTFPIYSLFFKSFCNCIPIIIKLRPRL